MSAEKTCRGPSDVKGQQCGRKVVAHGLCSSHCHQRRQAGGDESALRPIRGPHGQVYGEGSIRLELRNMAPEVVATLAELGAKVPPTDKREEVAANRGARYLAKAWAEGGAKFYAAHAPGRAVRPPGIQKRGESHKGRVDLRHVPEAHAKALEALGDTLEPLHQRDANLPLRGMRHLIQAYHEGGLRLLASHAPKT